MHLVNQLHEAYIKSAHLIWLTVPLSENMIINAVFSPLSRISVISHMIGLKTVVARVLHTP